MLIHIYSWGILFFLILKLIEYYYDTWVLIHGYFLWNLFILKLVMNFWFDRSTVLFALSTRLLIKLKE